MPKRIESSISVTVLDQDDLLVSDIATLRQRMSNGSLSCRQLTEAYLDRIDEIDRSGPLLRAVIEVNPDALETADRIDAERHSGADCGLMSGIPVLIKDNIETADRMVTSAGSLALENFKSAFEGPVVKRLRNAGAVILGKTNLSEWANFRSSASMSGWSSRGGQTKNPYVLDRSPSGSSSGAAVAVAASLCAVAVGTETNGSIVAPCSACGVVGIKPTLGLIQKDGIIRISRTFDTAGPIARTVADAAILLNVISDNGAGERRTQESIKRPLIDYSSFLDSGGLAGRRLGVEKAFLKGHARVVKLFRQAIDVLKNLGAEVVEVALAEEIQKLNDAAYVVYKYEFKAGIDAWLKSSNAGYPNLEDLIAFNRTRADEIMPHFGQELFEECGILDGLDSSEYSAAMMKVTGSKLLIDRLLQQDRLDGIVGTTFGLPDPIDLVLGDRDTGFYFGLPAALSGYPHITVPMGAISDLPIGLSFMAGPFKEPELIAMAFAFERASLNWRPPHFLQTAVRY